MPRHAGRRSSGGAVKTVAPFVNASFAPYVPIPEEVGLLRATWVKRKHLSEREREMVHAFLLRSQRRPLTEKQRIALGNIARQVGAVYEEPFELPRPPEGAVSIQPWGVLPKAPPGRRV